MAVQNTFEKLNLGTLHPSLMVEHFYDVIEHAPPPLGGNDLRPLFLKEDDDDNSPLQLEHEISGLEEYIRNLTLLLEEIEMLF